MSDRKPDAGDEDEIVVEIVDETPEADRNKPFAPEETENDDDITIPEGEVNQYRQKVQKRLKELTAKAHAERRTKETAVREREAAVSFAQQVAEENKRLRELALSNETMAIEQARARAKAEVAAAERETRDALETGDTEKIVAAQTKLARALGEDDRSSRFQPRPQPEPVAPPRAAPQVAEPDARAVEWAERNAWFGTDKRLTAFAYGLHEELVAEGVDPTSAAYYKRLDDEIRSTFPAKFRNEEERAAPPSRSSVVAPATRTARTPRTVQLSPSQVSVARRLGLTTEQYAAQIVKDSTNG